MWESLCGAGSTQCTYMDDDDAMMILTLKLEFGGSGGGDTWHDNGGWVIFMSKVVFCSSNIIVAVPASSALAFAPLF